MATPQPARPARPETTPGKKPLPELLPARMLNEFVYCPRRFYYEWVEGVFAPSADTVEGAAKHTRVDTEPGPLPPPGLLDEVGIRARSIELSSERLGLIGKLDLVESIAGETGSEAAAARPVDYKKGRPAEIDGLPAPWPADRAQIAAQVLLLRDNGYACNEGVLYYAATKQRVNVPVDDILAAEITAQIAQARATALDPQIPPPLEDSPKCPRCSLVGICLPDETAALHNAAPGDARSAKHGQLQLFPIPQPATHPVRQLISARDDLRPLYLNAQGMRVGKSGPVIQIREKDKLVQEARLGEITQINLFGNIQLSTQAIHAFCEHNIPVCYFSHGAWFYGITTGLSSKNVLLRRRQFHTADNPAFALELARSLTAGKIRNQRTLLRRNHIAPPPEALAQMDRLASLALVAESPSGLLGIEGAAAHTYFENFSGMIKAAGEDDFDASVPGPQFRFDFTTRNRRPPRDPVNALLSLAYSMLAKDLTIVCQALGFDPYWGYYHQPRFSRPALALDLMEPFRPLIADSAVLSAINTRMVTPDDFVQSGPSVALTPAGRKGFLRAYELRMDSLVTHPDLDYRVSYRRMLEIQARLLIRYLDSEIGSYPPSSPADRAASAPVMQIPPAPLAAPKPPPFPQFAPPRPARYASLGIIPRDRSPTGRHPLENKRPTRPLFPRASARGLIEARQSRRQRPGHAGFPRASARGLIEATS